MYRSVWWDAKKKDHFISTRNPDGSVRDIDEMNTAWKTFCTFQFNSSELHDWSNGYNGDHGCRKCGAWASGHNNPVSLPTRGCNRSHSLIMIPCTIVAPRLWRLYTLESSNG